MPYVTKIESRRTQRLTLPQLIYSNFDLGDIAITLSYAGNGEETSGADRIKLSDEFIRNLRKIYKAAGKELKYVAVVIHNLYVSNKIDRVELIVNGLGDAPDAARLLGLWWKYGTCQIASIQTYENLIEVAENMEKNVTGKYYISKNIAKAGR